MVTDSPSIPMHEVSSINILSNSHLLHGIRSQVYARHSSLLQSLDCHHRKCHGINESKVAKPRSRIPNALIHHHVEVQ